MPEQADEPPIVNVPDEGFDEPPRQPDGPGLGTVIAAFVLGLILAMTLGGTAYLLTESLAIGALVLELGFLFGVTGTLAVTGQSVWGALRLRQISSAALAPSLGLGFALLLGNVSATLLLGPPMQDVDFVISADSTFERIILVIAVALLAPVIEEMLFRGMLQGTLEKRLRPWLAIAVTSMAFALLHGPQGALFFFFWSLPIGWVTWRTDSIRPAIVVHAVNNLIGLVGLLATGVSDRVAPESGLGTSLFGALLLVVSVLLAVRLCRRIVRAAEVWERAA
jgi:membrane protease YdiL (CAAX protease family)